MNKMQLNIIKRYYILLSINVIRILLTRLIYGQRFVADLFQLLSPLVSIKIDKNGSITLGRGTHMRAGVALLAERGQIKIGSGVFINRNSYITSLDRIEIGAGSQIGPNVVIFDHDHDFRSGAGGCKATPIIIGENVWIGASSVILMGTKIGANCVIGAGSVVKGTVPPHTILIQKRETLISKYERSEISEV